MSLWDLLRGHPHRSADDNVAKLDAALELITEVRNDLAQSPPIPPTTPAVATPDAFDAALAACPPGGIVVCATALVYPTRLTITSPVQIVSELTSPWRITREDPCPQFLGGVRVQADDVTLYGLELRHPDPGANAILELSAMRPWIDRCRILGDPVNGGKRGILAHGGAQKITRCYVDDIKRKGQDTQAIFASKFLAPGLTIDDCWLAAAGQSIMCGGDRAGSEAAIPSQITLTHCDCTKHEAWLTEGWQVKCAVELKNAKGFTMRDSTAQWAGTSEGQAAYVFVLTPRNQYGDEPFTVVKDVLIDNVHARYGCGAMNFMGSDSNYPSQTLTNVTVRNVCFDEIDAKGPCRMQQEKGAGRMFLFQRAPHAVTLEAVTVNGQNLSASGYFIKQGAPPPTALVLRNLKLCPSTYGWKIDAGGQGEAALKAYCPDLVYEVTPTDAGAGEVPALP